MDMLAILKEDHDYILDLLRKIGLSVDAETREQAEQEAGLFLQLRQSLETHMAGEEQFFYSALEEDDAVRPRVIYAMEDHRRIKLFLGQMAACTVHREWNARFSLLREATEAHFAGEEIGLFGDAEHIFSIVQREELSRKIVAAEEEVFMEYEWKQQRGRSGLPK
ncbi:MAG: hemerythrin domain-containing protein [Nitrospirota bacterium]